MDRVSLGGLVESIEIQIHAAIQTVMAKITHIDDHDFASQRTSADQIEHQARCLLIESHLGFHPPLGTRQPGDVLFKNQSDTVHINIKSTDLGKNFHMPNLISSENLYKILTNNQDFMILKFNHASGKIKHWELWNIQDVDWKHLTLGALGTGQIQIRDALQPLSAWAGDRKSWRKCWKTRMIDFYQKEQEKTKKRISLWETRFDENS